MNTAPENCPKLGLVPSVRRAGLIKNIPNNNGRVGIWGISYSGWLVTQALLLPHPALKAASEESPDAVLLDIQMPLLDGYEVLRRLRQDPKLAHLRVMALTAFAMRGDREKALAAGFDSYHSKPINGQVLKRDIELLLKHDG